MVTSGPALEAGVVSRQILAQERALKGCMCGRATAKSRTASVKPLESTRGYTRRNKSRLYPAKPNRSVKSICSAPAGQILAAASAL